MLYLGVIPSFLQCCLEIPLRKASCFLGTVPKDFQSLQFICSVFVCPVSTIYCNSESHLGCIYVDGAAE